MSEHYGIGVPVVDIKSSVDGSLTESFSLPTPNSQGLQTDLSDKGTVHQLLNGKLIDYIEGYRLTYTINYADQLKKSDLKSIISILNYRTLEHRGGTKQDIWITAHTDNQAIRYKALLSSNTTSMKLSQQIAGGAGWKLITLEFTSVDILPTIDWFDPDNSIYVVNFQTQPFIVAL